MFLFLSMDIDLISFKEIYLGILDILVLLVAFQRVSIEKIRFQFKEQKIYVSKLAK